jgi:glucose-6-phosphate isomerase
MNQQDSTGRENMRLRLDYTNMLAEVIGSQHGIALSDLEKLQPVINDIHQKLTQRRDKNELPFMELPYQSGELGRIKELAQRIKQDVDNLVVVGIGGSALGPQALQQALNHPHYNLLSHDQRKGCPRIFFCDNIDPEQLQGLMDVLPMERTAINVITKSGSTAETIANFLVIRDRLIGQIGQKAFAGRIIATTDPVRGPLRQIAQAEGYATLDIHPGVGGRFSVFTAVGLFPAAVCGIDIDQLLAGAAYMDKCCNTPQLQHNPAYMNAALQYLANTRKGKPISVLMPYSSRLKYTAEWYMQLWAESLGKKYSLSGEVVNVGPTPVGAVGATDQHSQLQLYMEGPADKVVTFIRLKKFSHNLPLPDAFLEQEAFNYLGGHNIAELLLAEQTATAMALSHNGRPNCSLVLPELNPFNLGQLLYMLEVQTAVSGELYGINAFDQPGVEAGKQATYALMGRHGYEDKRKQIDRQLSQQRKYVV